MFLCVRAHRHTVYLIPARLALSTPVLPLLQWLAHIGSPLGNDGEERRWGGEDGVRWEGEMKSKRRETMIKQEWERGEVRSRIIGGRGRIEKTEQNEKRDDEEE